MPGVNGSSLVDGASTRARGPGQRRAADRIELNPGSMLLALSHKIAQLERLFAGEWADSPRLKAGCRAKWKIYENRYSFLTIRFPTPGRVNNEKLRSALHDLSSGQADSPRAAAEYLRSSGEQTLVPRPIHRFPPVLVNQRNEPPGLPGVGFPGRAKMLVQEILLVMDAPHQNRNECHDEQKT